MPVQAQLVCECGMNLRRGWEYDDVMTIAACKNIGGKMQEGQWPGCKYSGTEERWDKASTHAQMWTRLRQGSATRRRVSSLRRRRGRRARRARRVRKVPAAAAAVAAVAAATQIKSPTMGRGPTTSNPVSSSSSSLPGFVDLPDTPVHDITTMAVRPRRRDEFEIAVVCALPLEFDAAALAFDEFWDDDGDTYGRAPGDTNTYTTGRIGQYNVVLSLLSTMGKVSAASAASSLRSSYTGLRLALLTGICGGVPSPDHLTTRYSLRRYRRVRYRGRSRL
ncbi:Nucleoside phosphorylase [Colletotrichum higginsianum IMI 349063]|uniref:Nucleoside phosphorylase n=1 Tax=Colletotrichum higginsianum (strain IMI 349063) TaxID=759273 RepID=A0A1B7YR21_COLHI|nr:Nucleoside phosphorylase [Colletotrichum higginsianum IMI 349063]OBR14490.1 Nucleoside phosphorylase [Colletotrichum higginsianum IMI 349063]